MAMRVVYKPVKTSIVMAAYLAVAAPAIAQTPRGPEPGFTALRIDSKFEDWTTTSIERKAVSAVDGVLHLLAGAGWLRTKQLFGDFVVRFEVRGRDALPAFTMLVRGIGGQGKDPTPAFAYGIRIHDERGSVVVYDNPMRETPFRGNTLADALNASDAWLAFELSCIGPECTMRLNGHSVVSITNMEMPVGEIGFSVEYGELELRNLRVKRISPFTEGFAKGAYLKDDDPDLELPRIRHEVKPQYTPAAMQHKIEGTVLLAAVVTEDGSVSDIAMLRSLDPKFGLDHEAVLAARQWKFAPATLRGRAVPMLVTIELTFRLARD